MALSPEQKHDFLVGLDKEAKDRDKELSDKASKMSDEERHKRTLAQHAGTYKRNQSEDPHYFGMMKQLTLWGYFTSKPGATQALRYIAVPGRYEGCIPYKKGDKAWAT